MTVAMTAAVAADLVLVSAPMQSAINVSKYICMAVKLSGEHQNQFLFESDRGKVSKLLLTTFLTDSKYLT
jgi:hypothetical protein